MDFKVFEGVLSLDDIWYLAQKPKIRNYGREQQKPGSQGHDLYGEVAALREQVCNLKAENAVLKAERVLEENHKKEI